MRRRMVAVVGSWVFGAMSGLLVAQQGNGANEVDDEQLVARIASACAAAREAGRLVAASVLATQLAAAPSCERTAVPLRRQALAAPDLHDLVRTSSRIVGHYYLCTKCDEWHFSAASGFCVDAAGSVATCAHVVPPDETMREAFVVVADLDGHVWPVTKVLAASIAADLCVLQTEAKDTVPLPLRGGVRVGEAVWCLSHPDHCFAYFSGGHVARRFRQPDVGLDGAPLAAKGEAPAQRPWLHVTCEFAKGSSGGPVVDASGNVVAIAQSTTTVVYDETATPIDTQMVFRCAAPAEALQALLPPPRK